MPTKIIAAECHLTLVNAQVATILSRRQQTLFPQVKFDLLKGFYIVYFVSTNKKGITSTELSRKLSVRQKTCWAFKRKVMKAMKSSGDHPIIGEAEVDETVFGGQEEGVHGRKNGAKKLVMVGIEKKKKGVSRLYAKVMPDASSASLGDFMKFHISSSANITTDLWTGYAPLKKDFENLVRFGKKGGNFPEMHRAIMNLKSWLRGMHHHVWDLQDYFDDYCYRFNRSFIFPSVSVFGIRFDFIPFFFFEFNIIEAIITFFARNPFIKSERFPISSSVSVSGAAAIILLRVIQVHVCSLLYNFHQFRHHIGKSNIRLVIIFLTTYFISKSSNFFVSHSFFQMCDKFMCMISLRD